MDSVSLQILNWKNFSKNIFKENELRASLDILENALVHRTFLVNDTFSDAEKALFFCLHENQEFLSIIKDELAYPNVGRYYNNLITLPEIKSLISQQLAKARTSVKENKSKANDEKSKSNVQFEEGGVFVGLKDAEKGKVVVRFPPEASGYLHIGHAKAALINQHYKDHYEGKLIMRFDDTNPAKESMEFEKIILEDVKSLGLTIDELTFSSNHFDLLMKYCEDLIKAGHAYADNTDAETMKKEREACKNSKCRDQAVEDNLNYWNMMKNGDEEGLKYCIRIKMDMQSKNGCMRDPTIYRCKLESHVKTGDKYKVYPTYDFACPIVDSIEGVTHTLRTSEYNDRNDQFFKILDLVGLRKPAIADYSRLSLQNTVLSKRKLTWIVNEGYVDGWDDPRMPTVRGVLRHGMTIEGLKEFVLAQGFGRANVVMEWDKIWAFNKKVIDPVAPRYTGLSGSDKSLIVVRVIGQQEIVKDSVARHPKNDSVGKKSVWYSPSVVVEREDAVDFVEGTNVTFINWGNLLIAKIHKDDTGSITSIDAKLNLSDRDFKKTQKITWMPLGDEDNIRSFSIPMCAIFYDNIITKKVLDKDDDFKNFLNKDSKKEECLIGDVELKYLKKGDIIQLQRRGYFICDQEYRSATDNATEHPLILINIPEGNKKERPTTGLKQKSQGDNKESNTSKKGNGAQNGANDKKDKKKKNSDENEAKDKKEKNKKNGNENEAKDKQEKNKKNDESKVAKTNNKEVKEVKKNGKKDKDQKQTPVAVENENKTELKKVTRLGMEALKEENLADWYKQILTKSKMIGYYDVSGCYILLPTTEDIWEMIRDFIKVAIKKMGVRQTTFPLFISKRSLMKEKDHIADFSPEVAWVTMAGEKTMEEPIAIRPTSETAMYPYFAQTIKSHRDLPLKLNQWANVVRWEFKHPIPLLRSREFLWQEGHTAFAEQEEAVEEVYQILDLYASVYQDLLAIPVVKGRKTEKEKFAGADFTTTTEVYISAAGRAIQGATSHHLGQNFSKMFDIKYQLENDTQRFVYQNSWGMTTRTIGIMVMVHGDNKGLVLPPRVADVQVVIVPCGLTVNEDGLKALKEKCNSLADRLSAVGIRVFADLAEDRSPGWKFNDWELKGVPIRIEIGPRDISNNKMVLCYRFNGKKEIIDDGAMEQFIKHKLIDIHNEMYNKAKFDLDNHRIVAYNMDDLCKGLDNKMLITAPFCGDKSCEETIKVISAGKSIVEEGAPSMGAKSLCIPLEQPENLGDKCVNTQCTLKPKYFTMFGRSY